MSKDYQYTKINIDEIKPYEQNARIHSSKQIKQIMEAIKAFGFTNPLFIARQIKNSKHMTKKHLDYKWEFANEN